MNQNKYVFAQLVDFLPYDDFYYIVKKYKGNKGIRDFSCWNQLLKMMFGQLAACESLRDLCIFTQAHHQKSYHLGFGNDVNLSTISRANAHRDYRIFEEFAAQMIAKAQKCRADIELDIKVDGHIYAFDSSTISLCLNVFWWATYKSQKGGIKLHTLYDVRTQIPEFVIITPASLNDVNGMDYIAYQAGSYYIFDRGYNDFARLYNIHQHKAFFVFRARENVKFQRMYSIKRALNTGVKSDQIGVFTTGKSPQRYPEKIRKIRYHDAEHDREFIFLTNDFHSDARTITELYRKRWGIELFFKWIKQHLKIKSFWGTTENAVKIQINCAIIAYCLVAIVAKSLKTEHTIYEILQILGKSLLDKTPINQLLNKTDYKNVKEQHDNLLIFN
ncbi:IS4 family transposase [Bacteroidia bacterium]|nr:IS4 family transposase [Bacteroidia bacterium]